MTYLISTITDEGILMASDSRLNYHHEALDHSTNERYQLISAVADCIEKTFLLEPFKIGIQFLGIGYFQKGNDKFPLSHFIQQICEDVLESDPAMIKFKKIYSNLKDITEKGNTGQYVNGVMACYDNNIPYIATFNTFIDDFSVNAYEPGAYVESEPCSTVRPKDKKGAIKYINEKITDISKKRFWDVGGPIDILELKPDNSSQWLQKNPLVFSGSLTELLENFKNNPQNINGQLLNPPIKQKLNL